MDFTPLYVVLAVVAMTTHTVKSQAYIINSDTLPEDDRFKPNIGNGHVGTSVLTDTVYVNGVMNGYMDDSHRARIPSTNAINITYDGTEERTFSLNMYEGYFTQRITHDDFGVEQKFYAHRANTRLLVAEITIWRINSMGDIDIGLELNQGEESPDFDMSPEELLHDGLRYQNGTIYQPETNTSEHRQIHIYWTDVPSNLTLNQNQHVATWTFITSLSTTREDALQAFNDGLASLQEQRLFASHAEAWKSLWDNGRIEIGGNPDLGETLYAALYYILSSTPLDRDLVNPFIGLSPGGLPRGGKVRLDKKGGPYNDYAGHVFWDMDTWIMPPVMMFHPEMATRMIESRSRVLEVVQDYAEETGYTGVRFPWEQCYTGVETCPWPPASQYQVHITADVSYSIRQYLYATMDTDFLTNPASGGEELAMNIARFWESRSEYNEENDRYEIHRVMGPDEYHENVNNSVFTNFQAKLSLQLPEYILSILSNPGHITEEDATRWRQMSEKLYILFDEEMQYHPQFEGFVPDPETVEIKQSDVVLLGYPLMSDMTPQVRKNDLEIYEELTDDYGPDTGTWSMHTVGWLELGDEEKAHGMFRKMFRNLNGPFKIFSEKPESGEEGVRCVNFITGAGGMLQSVFFGYGGLRLRAKQLDLDPYVPQDSDSISFYGLKYRGFVFDMVVTADHVTVTLTDDHNAQEDMIVLVKATGERHTLAATNAVTFSRGKATIVTTGNADVLPTSQPPSEPATVVDGGVCPQPWSLALLLLFAFAVLHI